MKNFFKWSKEEKVKSPDPARQEIQEKQKPSASRGENSPNLSEPVISFLRTLEKEPKRFGIKRTHIDHYVFYDKKFNLSWEFLYTCRGLHKTIPICLGLEWASSEEKMAIQDGVEKWLEVRNSKVRRYLNKRTKKAHQKDRDALTEIYCGGIDSEEKLV